MENLVRLKSSLDDMFNDVGRGSRQGSASLTDWMRVEIDAAALGRPFHLVRHPLPVHHHDVLIAPFRT